MRHLVAPEPSHAFKVSVIVPCRNTRQFLDARLSSIQEQTLDDFEVIVIDGNSTDGSWEFWRNAIERDARINAHQSPPEGIYPAWNEGIRASIGKYVYIATSDDTMMPDCLEKLSAALDRHPECDIATSCLTKIDAQGRPFEGDWEGSFVTRFFGDWMKKEHLRLAPHDGLLYCAERCVYTSITQVLIRRSLFDEIGLFREDLGSEADWEWEMRASLVRNTVHIPEFLATWRVHPGQATQGETRFSIPDWHRDVEKMIRLAVSVAQQVRPEFRRPSTLRRMTFIARWHRLAAELRLTDGALQKYLLALRGAILNVDVAANYLLRKLGFLRFELEWEERLVRREMRRFSQKPLLVEVEES